MQICCGENTLPPLGPEEKNGCVEYRTEHCHHCEEEKKLTYSAPVHSHSCDTNKELTYSG